MIITEKIHNKILVYKEQIVICYISGYHYFLCDSNDCVIYVGSLDDYLNIRLATKIEEELFKVLTL